MPSTIVVDIPEGIVLTESVPVVIEGELVVSPEQSAPENSGTAQANEQQSSSESKAISGLDPPCAKFMRNINLLVNLNYS